MDEDAPRVLCYRTPAGTGRAEFEEKRSRFIGSVGPAADAAEAQTFVAAVRAEMPDASHHAWVYRLEPGPQGAIGSSDDGEPGGTAGGPMLAVLDGSALAHIVVVGTRYYGGIKLGTGGLVRAYGRAARLALAETPIEERVWHRLASIGFDYAAYGAVRHALPSLGVRVEAERFAERVGLDLAVPYDAIERTGQVLRDLTSGEIALQDCWQAAAGRWATRSQTSEATE